MIARRSMPGDHRPDRRRRRHQPIARAHRRRRGVRPAKGATAQVAHLDAGLANLVAAFTCLDMPAPTPPPAPGSGAAGGIGFAAMLLGASTVGSDYFLDLLDFDRHVGDADLVITGEGRLDHQTLQGKLPAAAALRAAPTPVVAVVGRNDLDADTADTGFADILGLPTSPTATPPKIRTAPQNCCSTSEPRSEIPLRDTGQAMMQSDASEPMRNDIRLLGAILGHGPRAERRSGLRAGRAGPCGIVSGAPLRDRTCRVGRLIRRDRHPSGHPGHPRLHPFRAVGQRCGGHSPRAAAAIHIGAGEPANSAWPPRSGSSTAPGWMP